jgi:hypothetical protein
MSPHVIYSLVDSPALDFITELVVKSIKTEIEVKKVEQKDLSALYEKYKTSSLPFIAFADNNVIDSFALNFIFRRLKSDTSPLNIQVHEHGFQNFLNQKSCQGK